MLECVEKQTGPQPVASVIWLHGLGADGNDFVPIIPELVRPGERALRFVFPHAPVRPVTINGGYAMRAWYDIVGLDRHSQQDEAGIRASALKIEALIARENQRGIATERIVLAGFSQGGAMAVFTGTRHAQRLGGIVALSCYLLGHASFEAQRSVANQRTPIFAAHGSQDPVVAPALGEHLRETLERAGYPLEWHSYPMPHTVSMEEIAAIAAWLRSVL